MKRLLFFIAFPATLLFGVGIWAILQNRVVTNTEKIKVETTEEFQKPENQEKVLEKEFSFENVHFVYDTSLFSDVKGEVISAKPLESIDNKPDYVYPKHVDLTFFGSYLEKYAENYQDSVTVKVCSVNDFNQAFSISKDFERTSERGFNQLKLILQHDTKFSPSGNDQLIFIPWWDVSQAFHSRVRVINFKNGKGVLFLTQLQQDAGIINNERLTYIFQGLTNNGKHFILMMFPVSGDGLSDSVYDDYPEKYKKLNDYSLTNSYQNLYQKYTTEMAIKINQMPSEKFTPNLTKIESLIRSLNVK